MKYLVIITGDVNDADYVHEYSEVDDDTMVVIRKVAAGLKEKKRKWPSNEYSEEGELAALYSDILTEKELEIFSELVPRRPEHTGVHTVDDITVYTFTDKELIL